MSRHEDFHAMLAAARVGAEWAWRALYRELAPAVLRYVSARGCRDPEDVVGDVFVQVVRNIGTFEGGPESFRSWVFTIAHRRALDAARAQRRSREDSDGDEVLVRHAATGDVEEEALRALAVERVEAVLDELTPDQRDVLMLRIVADLAIADVAHVLGKTPGAVKTLQARAVATLRRKNLARPVSSRGPAAFAGLR